MYQIKLGCWFSLEKLKLKSYALTYGDGLCIKASICFQLIISINFIKQNKVYSTY